MEKAKRMGRPETPAYRKIRHRYSAIEDRFTPVLEQLTKKDKELVLTVLEDLKRGT